MISHMITGTKPYFSVEETVQRFKESSKEFCREIDGNPEKAKDFLVRAGIAQRKEGNPSEIELVPELRSEN